MKLTELRYVGTKRGRSTTYDDAFIVRSYRRFAYLWGWTTYTYTSYNRPIFGRY